MKWPEKVGEPKVLAEAFGRTFQLQHYRHPLDNTVDDFAEVYVTRQPVIILPLTENLEVIVLRQFRYAPAMPLIEIPGGVIEPDQSPEETVKKELREETGYEAEAIQQLGITTIFFEPATLTHSYYPFLATGCCKVGEPKADKWEFFELLLMSLEEWFELLGNNDVRDDKNHAVTWRAMRYLKRNLGWDVPSPW